MRWALQSAAFIILLTFACVPALATEPSDLQPLWRFYNTASEQHYYTLSEAEANAWRQRADVREDHVIGRVSPRQLPGTARLYRATFSSGLKHSYFTGQEDAVPAGSLDKANFEAYVWIQPGDGRIPVYYNSLSRGTDQYYSYILEHVRRYARESKTAKQGLRSTFSDSIAYWVYPPLPEQLAARQAEKPAHGAAASSAPAMREEETLATPMEATPAPPKISDAVDPRSVVFNEILLTFPVTSLDITDDGRWLVISHQLGDVVTVYDILNNKIDHVFSAQSPRTVVCQGDRLFIANYGLGTVGVYSISQGWQQIDELQVPKKQIVHLSIADGPENSDVLLATCHGDGRQASYQDTHNYRIDVKQDRAEEISRRPLLLASKDGRYVVDVQSFGLSGGGSLSGYHFDQFVADERSATKLFSCQIENDTFSQEGYRKGTWFSQTQVMSGAPLQRLNAKPFRLVIPDFSQSVFYDIDGDVIRARRLDTALSEIDMRRIELPEPFRNFDQLCNWRKRTREYFLDLPKAYTHGDRLHLFFTSAENGRLLTANTEAFIPLDKAGTPKTIKHPRAPSTGSSPSASVPRTERGASAPVTKAITDLQHEFPSYLVAGQLLQHEFKLPAAGRIELASQLTGAELSPTGKLRWQVPNEPNTVATLKLRVETDDGIKFVRISSEILHPELLSELGGDLSKWPEHQRIDVDAPIADLKLSRDGKQLLLLRDKRLSVLSRDGCRIEKTLRLPKNYSFVDLRGEYLIAASPREVDVIIARNMQVQRTIDVTEVNNRIEAVTDLALHPTQRECYLCVKIAREELRYSLLRVDEVTGSVEPTRVPATWAQVSPDGQLIYIGYRDLFKRGVSLEWNPGGLFTRDHYGNIDMLMQLRIGQGLDLEQAIFEAGGNGKGIRLSSGGRRIVYLSHTGDPQQKDSLVGWDCNNFDHSKAIYPTQGAPATYHLCFHPQLAIAAVPEKKSVVLYGSDDGQRLKSQLLIPLKGIGEDEIRDMEFSPDGGHLVLLCGGLHGLYTRSITIKWTADDLRRTEAILSSQDRSLVAFEPVAAGQLDSLQPPTGSIEPLTPKEIGRKFMSAVVSIRASNKIGSGFFVGKGGYVLTNAHVVRGAEIINILHGENSRSKTEFTAKIVRIDAAKDLALLKADLGHEVPVVILASKASKSESGEPVTVIGSPGLGDKMLEQTMTTGIVSNPQREMDGAKFIQTDAPVNPGNSGGPMFDGRGQVIGMVAQKASLEGTGFAIPAAALRNFLETTERNAQSIQQRNEYRTFRDRTESFSIEARVIELQLAENKVVLERRDGRRLTVNFDQLSEADQDALRNPQ